MPDITSFLFLLLLAFGNLITPSAHAADTTASPELVAQYLTRHVQLSSRPRARQQQWQFWRSSQRVEKRLEDGSLTEVWTLSGRNTIRYQRLYPKHKRLLDYDASDLRSLGQYPRWQEVAHIIDPAFLAKLSQTGTTTIQGQPAIIYKGQLDSVDWEITWLDQQAIPAIIRQVTANQEYSITLQALYSLDKAPFPKLDSRDFQSLDFSDLGDNEADPFWARVAHH